MRGWSNVPKPAEDVKATEEIVSLPWARIVTKFSPGPPGKLSIEVLSFVLTVIVKAPECSGFPMKSPKVLPGELTLILVMRPPLSFVLIFA